MAQELRIQSLGLKTNPSPQMAPQGSLDIASNVVQDSPGIFEPRRGFARYGASMGVAGSSMATFGSYTLRHYGTTLQYDASGTWTSYSGSYSPQGSKLRFVEQNKSLFILTSTGLQKLTSGTSTPTASGVPRALGGTASLAATAPTWFVKNNQVAYRLLWGYKDANGYSIVGMPSDRVTITNPNAGADKSVSITFNVPSGISAGWFYQLYRSPLSGSESTAPSDELAQVYEGTYTSGSTLTIADILPVTLTGQYLYTNANTGVGILQGNEPPPIGTDLALFRGYLLMSNTQKKQNLLLTLLGTGSPNGVQNGDTLIFNSNGTTFTITGAAAENTATGAFLVSNTGVPATDVELTAKSIVNVVNNYASNTWLNASYTSGSNDFPGKMWFEARAFTTAQFYVATNNVRVSYSPTVPSGATLTSTNEAQQNRVCYSRVGLPEAFPGTNYLDIGSANSPIDRMVALRDSVFFFKDEGVYRLVGYDPSTWQVSVFDNTINLLANESIDVFDNVIYCLTTQGVTTVSDGGSTIISFDIENQLRPLYSLSNIETTFGLAYPTDRKYILWMPQTATDTMPTKGFVYQTNTHQWTSWDISASCGVYHFVQNKLYLGWSDFYTRQERKTITDDDIRDNSISVSISAVSGVSVTVDTVSGVTVGMILRQGSIRGEVLAINTLTLTIDSALPYATGAAFIDEPVIMQMRYNPIVYGNPGIRKIASRFQVFFGNALTSRAQLLFRSDYSSFDEGTTVIPNLGEGWGTTAWGTSPWGGSIPVTQVVRTYVPREKVRHTEIQPQIYLKDSTCKLQVEGFSIMYEGMNEQQK